MADGDVLLGWDGGSLPPVSGATPAVSGDFLIWAASTAAAFAAFPFTARVFSARYYVEDPPVPGGLSWSTLHMHTPAAVLARVNFTGSGAPHQVRFFRSASAEVPGGRSATNLLSESQLYRIELLVDSPGQRYRGAVFTEGSDIPIFDTGVLSSQDTGSTPPAELRIGRVTSMSTGQPVRVGRILVKEGFALVGRHPSDALPSSRGIELLGSWSGSTLLEMETLGRWAGTGSPVSSEAVGIWDGSSFGEG